MFSFCSAQSTGRIADATAGEGSLQESLDLRSGLVSDIIYERTKGSGKSTELRAFGTVTAALRTGVIPADLRAAFYRAAVLIPGVTVVDRQATVDGRTGIAMGTPSPDGGSRQETIIDPATGLMIGERDVLLKDYPGSPPDRPNLDVSADIGG
jgi:hypothetical protein